MNVNSFPSKFDQLKKLVLKYADVLVISETKLDDTFLTSQFLVDSFSEPFRLYRNKFGGGIIIFVREDMPSKRL